MAREDPQPGQNKTCGKCPGEASLPRALPGLLSPSNCISSRGGRGKPLPLLPNGTELGKTKSGFSEDPPIR